MHVLLCQLWNLIIYVVKIWCKKKGKNTQCKTGTYRLLGITDLVNCDFFLWNQSSTCYLENSGLDNSLRWQTTRKCFMRSIATYGFLGTYLSVVFVLYITFSTSTCTVHVTSIVQYRCCTICQWGFLWLVDFFCDQTTARSREGCIWDMRGSTVDQIKNGLKCMFLYK